MDREKHAGPCTRALGSRINKEQIIITNVFPPVHLDQLKIKNLSERSQTSQRLLLKSCQSHDLSFTITNFTLTETFVISHSVWNENESLNIEIIILFRWQLRPVLLQNLPKSGHLTETLFRHLPGWSF